MFTENNLIVFQKVEFRFYIQLPILRIPLQVS